MSVEEKTVLITGASRGIGEAAARVFAQAGANVVLMARSTADIQRIAGEIGPKALAIAGDVSRYADVEAAVAASVKAFGRIDILINNAGAVEPIRHMADADPNEWAQVVNINLNGVFFGMRAVLPHMRTQGGGTVLTISSGAAHDPIEAWSHYCASKAGAAMLTRSLDLEERQNGIRAIGLSPGTVATQMQRDIKASGINPISKLEWEDHISPDWPARTLLWMCGSEANEYLGEEVSLRDPDIRKKVGLE